MALEVIVLVCGCSTASGQIQKVFFNFTTTEVRNYSLSIKMLAFSKKATSLEVQKKSTERPHFPGNTAQISNAPAVTKSRKSQNILRFDTFAITYKDAINLKINGKHFSNESKYGT